MEDTECAKATAVIAGISGVISHLSSGISKDRKNEQQGYKFRGIDDVYNALSGALFKCGIVILPSYSGHVVAQKGETKTGSKLYEARVHGKFRIVSVLDGSEVTVEFPGEATDQSDKATNKAMSAAYKYMCLQTFCIPTEGDNDADSKTFEVLAKKQRSAKQILSSISNAVNMEELSTIATELESCDGGTKDACREAFMEKMSSI